MTKGFYVLYLPILIYLIVVASERYILYKLKITLYTLKCSAQEDLPNDFYPLFFIHYCFRDNAMASSNRSKGDSFD
jgi:hypothetical protein